MTWGPEVVLALAAAVATGFWIGWKARGVVWGQAPAVHLDLERLLETNGLVLIRREFFEALANRHHQVVAELAGREWEREH